MSLGRVGELRRLYHSAIFERVLRARPGGTPSNADKGSAGSVWISKGIVCEIGLDPANGQIAGQSRQARPCSACRSASSCPSPPAPKAHSHRAFGMVGLIVGHSLK